MADVSDFAYMWECPACDNPPLCDMRPPDHVLEAMDPCTRCERHGVVFEYSRPQFNQLTNQIWTRGFKVGIATGGAGLLVIGYVITWIVGVI